MQRDSQCAAYFYYFEEEDSAFPCQHRIKQSDGAHTDHASAALSKKKIAERGESTHVEW